MNTMHKAPMLFAASLVAALATAYVLEPVSLKRVAKVGDAYKYDLKVDLEMEGMAMTYKAKVSEKILEVKDDNYISEMTTSEQVVDMMGSEMPAGDDMTSKTTFGLDGSIKKIETDQATEDMYRFAQLMAFYYPDKPVDTGAKWEIKIPADKDKGTVATTANYEITGRETLMGHDTFKVAYTVKETEGSEPASATVTAWVDVKSGVLVKAEGEMKNAPQAGMVLDAKFSQTMVH